MKTIDFDKVLAQPEYDFFKTNQHLGDNIIILGLGGSYSYGTNHEGSDIDFRGIATRTPKEILVGADWEQVVIQQDEPDIDATVYSANKYITMAMDSNPNTIELLGLREEDYALVSPVGRLLIDNRKIFLSQIAAYSFGEYANTQLRRLSNKAARKLPQAELEAHILKSMDAQVRLWKEKLDDRDGQFIKLYLDDSVEEGMEKEIFFDCHLTHYSLRQWPALCNDFYNIVRSYDKLGQRNKKAIEHGKLNKHMCHLIRLYVTGADVLETGDIRTRQDAYLPLFKDILAGKYIDENSQPTPEFNELVETMTQKLAYAKKHTCLPLKPDYEKIKDLKYEINRMVLTK